MRQKVGPGTSNGNGGLRLVPTLLSAQINASLAPTSLEIFNDSHLHAHHKAMQGTTSRETHFRYFVRGRVCLPSG